MSNPVKLFSEMISSPLGDLIASIGKGVGEAQAALDNGSLKQTLDIYDISTDSEKSESELKLLNLIRSMGYQPTFYTLPETEVEAQVSLSMDIKYDGSSQFQSNRTSKHVANVTPINANNINRYGLNASAMAKLKFKIVPVPPPNSSEIRMVPDLINKEFRIVNSLLHTLGISFSTYFLNKKNEKETISLDENATNKIINQSIAANEIINTEKVIELEVTPT